MGATARRRIGAVTTPGGGSEHVPTEPETAPLPDPPAWLGDDAVKVWTQLAPIVPDDNLTAATADSFALLCVALATYQEAHGIILEAGLLLAQGQDLVQNPAYAIRSQQNPVALALLKTFGLTPDTPPSTKPGCGGYRPHLVKS
jgi:P27 family predicted phage terminase small subunit